MQHELARLRVDCAHCPVHRFLGWAIRHFRGEDPTVSMVADQLDEVMKGEGEYAQLADSLARAHAFEGMSREEVEARMEWMKGADLDDSPYCECGACHSIEEEDSNQCDCCGRLVA